MSLESLLLLCVPLVFFRGHPILPPCSTSHSTAHSLSIEGAGRTPVLVSPVPVLTAIVMPSRCSRRSAAAYSVGLAVGLTTAPSRAFVTGWVLPTANGRGLRVGRGIVRQRSTPVGSPNTSCRCDGAPTMCSAGRNAQNESVIGDQERSRSSWREQEQHDVGGVEGLKKAGISMLAGLFIMAGGGGGGGVGGVAAALAEGSLVEPTSSVTVQDLQRYDGFEDYAAQGQQMENSDVGCFANECKRETASCFTDGSCLKVSSPSQVFLLCMRIISDSTFCQQLST